MNTPINGPKDPNNITGPAGFGEQNFVSVNQVLPYTIQFENEPTAGFPAQQVVITQQLDPDLNAGCSASAVSASAGRLTRCRPIRPSTRLRST